MTPGDLTPADALAADLLHPRWTAAPANVVWPITEADKLLHRAIVDAHLARRAAAEEAAKGP